MLNGARFIEDTIRSIVYQGYPNLEYIVVDGVAYPVAPQLTKRYVRTLEQFGGKASVLFDEFDRWFASLWRGRTLALTVACLSTAVAAGLFLFARWLPDRD